VLVLVLVLVFSISIRFSVSVSIRRGGEIEGVPVEGPVGVRPPPWPRALR
jgi:hypothetical protein